MPYMILSMRGIIVSKQTCGQRVARHARRTERNNDKQKKLPFRSLFRDDPWAANE